MFDLSESLSQIKELAGKSDAGSANYACQPRSVTLQSGHPRFLVNKPQSHHNTH